MTRVRIASLFAAVALSAASLAAQGTQGTTTKKPNPVRDSLKAVVKDIKHDKADRKTAKAAGDIAKAKADTKDIKQDKQDAAALRSRLPKKKAAPAKKP